MLRRPVIDRLIPSGVSLAGPVGQIMPSRDRMTAHPGAAGLLRTSTRSGPCEA
ncbi:hypothetical protein ITI46_01185 [Streptomyces oryzae]|uniref:Uncharacterized protein n=1 Tax=Streptomyces oryzae TaxID=1434886 RepID=A0ABS3X4N6_9ACTN|nr:hypothetical protein [Streptomyces oryzae]MBO8190335.1 hypothetical protein [Streptomyces oryzae]